MAEVVAVDLANAAMSLPAVKTDPVHQETREVHIRGASHARGVRQHRRNVQHPDGVSVGNVVARGNT